MPLSSHKIFFNFLVTQLNFFSLFYQLGVALWNLGKNEEAIKCYDEVFSITICYPLSIQNLIKHPYFIP